MENFIQGIDVSRWQGTNINWNHVKEAGYQFTFVKSTDGSAYKQAFIDIAKKQADDALSAGIKIGYYHFAHPAAFPSIQIDASAEANFFVETVSNGLPTPSFPLVLDFEDDKMLMRPVDVDEWISIFAKVVQDAGYEFMIYTSKSYAEQHLPSNHQYGAYPLWIAKYPQVINLDNPPLPPQGWLEWKIWQYSESGVVQGIEGAAVDLNIMQKDFFDKY